jgi:hypothetical protein
MVESQNNISAALANLVNILRLPEIKGAKEADEFTGMPN